MTARYTFARRAVVMSGTALLCTMLVLASPRPAAAQECFSGDAAWAANADVYGLLSNTLSPNLDNLKFLLDDTHDQDTYAVLVSAARAVADSIGGRLVVTVPDGTVVVDTARADADEPANANSYAHFVAKSINENHNSRVAILLAQLYPCGLGIETRLSSTTGRVESYFANRLGAYLNNSGTARLSIVQ